MSDLRAEIIGTNNLCSQFDQIQIRLQDKIKDILAKAGEPTLQAMISGAPRSKFGAKGNKLASRNHDPGTLKRSIKILKSGGVGKFPTIWIKPVKTFGQDPDGWYAHFVEFGTVNQPAQGFIRKAYDHTKSEVENSISKSVMNEITQVWGSGVNK